MKRSFLYSALCAALISVWGCADTITAEDAGDPRALTSVTAEVVSAIDAPSRAVNASDPTMTAVGDRTGWVMDVDIVNGTPGQYTYDAGQAKWLPVGNPAYFPNLTTLRTVAVALNPPTGAPGQDGTALGLMSADLLETTLPNYTPASSLSGVVLQHKQTLIDFNMGDMVATEVKLGTTILAYNYDNTIPTARKWQAIIAPATTSFVISVKVGAETFTATMNASSTSTAGEFLSNYKYSVNLVLDGDKLVVVPMGVEPWGEAGGNYTGQLATMLAVAGAESQTGILTFKDGTTKNISFDATGVALCSANVVSNVIKSLTIGANTYFIGRVEGGDIALDITGTNGALKLRSDASGNKLVNTLAEMRLISAGLDGNYLQTSDIDLMGDLEDIGKWMPAGNNSSDDADTRFTGRFDGGGFTLGNLTVAINGNYAGLFGYNAGTVRNVNIISGNIAGKQYVGGICGYNSGTTESCTNTVDVASSAIANENSFAGGVCGYNAGTITASRSTGALNGVDRVGGICGENAANITASYSTGAISGSMYVGGVCGINTANITACYSAGSVNGATAVGGVCGESSGVVTTCYWLDYMVGLSGIGNPASNTNATPFDPMEWPSTDLTGWALYSASGYWKSLGSWAYGGFPTGMESVFPKLWMEK